MLAPTGQSELTYTKDERSAFALSIRPLCCLLPLFSPIYLLDAPLFWLCGAADLAAARGELLLCQGQVCGLAVRAPRSWSSQGNSHKARSVRKEGPFLQAGFSNTENLYFILQTGDSDAF